MARMGAMGLEGTSHRKRQEMPIGRDHIQPFIYSIFTNGNRPQGFSDFFSARAFGDLHPRSGYAHGFSKRCATACGRHRRSGIFLETMAAGAIQAEL
jgi:hypothetical protein